MNMELMAAGLIAISKREDCWQQYTDGAITFVEAVYFLADTITPEEIKEHEALFPAQRFMGRVQLLIEENQ